MDHTHTYLELVEDGVPVEKDQVVGDDVGGASEGEDDGCSEHCAGDNGHALVGGEELVLGHGRQVCWWRMGSRGWTMENGEWKGGKEGGREGKRKEKMRIRGAKKSERRER